MVNRREHAERDRESFFDAKRNIEVACAAALQTRERGEKK